MATVVTFGEIMLRLSTPGFQRFVQARQFDVAYGGGEANVAISLAQFKHLLHGGANPLAARVLEVAEPRERPHRTDAACPARTPRMRTRRGSRRHCPSRRAGQGQHLPSGLLRVASRFFWR